jgi:hypothetical protein
MKAQTNLTSALLAGVMSLILTLHASAQSQQSIDETRQVSANEKITLEVMRGDVRIRTGSDNTFSVRGQLDELAEGFELESENGFTRFEVVMPRSIRGSRNEEGSDLEIVLPANSDVEFTGVNVAVDAAGILGGASITTVNGDIVASDLGGVVALKTVNGPINSSNNRGRVSLQTVNGEITDNGSSGRLEVSTVNGAMDINSAAEEVTLNMVNGEVQANFEGTGTLEFNGINGEMRIAISNSQTPRVSGSSVSGEIELQLDADVDARFDLRTNVGSRIHNGITDDEAQRPQFGPGRSLQFTTGQGNGSVELNTVSGSIDILAE